MNEMLSEGRVFSVKIGSMEFFKKCENLQESPIKLQLIYGNPIGFSRQEFQKWFAIALLSLASLVFFDGHWSKY